MRRHVNNDDRAGRLSRDCRRLAHLLPALLATGRELPAGHNLPGDLAPAAAFHPPPGWRPPTL